jgi:hypothetical protein
MEYYTALGYIFNTLAMLIFVYILIHSIVRINKKEKLKTNDYALQVFTPNTIALLLFAVGTWIIITQSILKDGFDEPFFIQFITATAAGGTFVSMMSIFLSYHLVYWKA